MGGAAAMKRHLWICSEGRDGEVTLDFVTFYGPLQEVIA